MALEAIRDVVCRDLQVSEEQFMDMAHRKDLSRAGMLVAELYVVSPDLFLPRDCEKTSSPNERKAKLYQAKSLERHRLPYTYRLCL